MQIKIKGVEFVIKQMSSRLSMITPVEGWSTVPRGKLRRKLLLKVTACEQCGSTKHLEAHHIKPIKYLKTKKGHYYQDPAGNHELSNGILLCRKCHVATHCKTST